MEDLPSVTCDKCNGDSVAQDMFNATAMDVDRAPVMRLVFIVIKTVLLTAGIVGGILAIRVSLRCGMSPRMQMYYVVMMAVDISICFFVYLINDVLIHDIYAWSSLPTTGETTQLSNDFCKYQSYLFFTMQFCSNYLALLLTVERCVAACKPFWAQHFNMKRSMIMIIFIFFTGFLIHGWCFLLTSGVVRRHDNDRSCHFDLTVDEAFNRVLVSTTVDLTFPSTLTLVLSIIVAVRVWRSVKFRKSIGSIANGNKKQLAVQPLPKSPSQSRPLQKVSSYAHRIAEIKNEMMSSKEVQSTLTLVACSFSQCVVYSIAGCVWLSYAITYRQQYADIMLSQSARIGLVEFCTALCGLPHFIKCFIILKRTKATLKRTATASAVVSSSNA